MRDPLVFLGNKLMQGWEKFVTLLLPPNSRLYQIGDPHQIFSNSAVDLTLFARDHGYFAVKKPLVGKVTRSKKDTEAAIELLERVYETYRDSPYCAPITGEILTKVLAFRTLWEGCRVKIPVLSEEGVWILAPYQVDKIFNLWNSIPAFGLIPENQSEAGPLLLFRGTQFSPFLKSGRASIVADLDPSGPGRTLFEFSRPHLVDWLKKATKERKARVMGYSLGGALAAYLLIEESDYFSKEASHPSLLFQCPGITPDLLKKWENLSENERPAFEVFITQGDLVSKIGHLFGRATHLKLKRSLPLISAHTTLMFAQTGCHLNLVDIEKENGSFYRNHYTIMHKSTSELFCRLGFKRLFPQVQAK